MKNTAVFLCMKSSREYDVMYTLIKWQEDHTQFLKDRNNILFITYSSAYHCGLDLEDSQKIFIAFHCRECCL